MGIARFQAQVLTGEGRSSEPAGSLCGDSWLVASNMEDADDPDKGYWSLLFGPGWRPWRRRRSWTRFSGKPRSNHGLFRVISVVDHRLS